MEKQNNYDTIIADLLQSVHVGNMVEAEFRKQGMSVTWFANLLHCDRRNVYDIFNRASIDTSLLIRISCILNVNFFDTISKTLYSIADEDTLSSPPPFVNRRC